MPNFGRDTTEEPLECVTGFLRKTTYSFSIEVETGFPAAGGGGGGALRREGFEWRASHGDEVKELERCSRGWKLVRLHGEADGIGGTRAVRDVGTTSDGKEVVAVFGDCMGWRTKVAKFRFLGTAAAGQLGPRVSNTQCSSHPFQHRTPPSGILTAVTLDSRRVGLRAL